MLLLMQQLKGRLLESLLCELARLLLFFFFVSRVATSHLFSQNYKRTPSKGFPPGFAMRCGFVSMIHVVYKAMYSFVGQSNVFEWDVCIIGAPDTL